VYASGTFTKTNGIITGYGSDTVNGNKVVNAQSVIQNNKGHAVYVSSSKRLENTVSAGHNLDSRVDGAAGGWTE
jgi:hypothetical protein